MFVLSREDRRAHDPEKRHRRLRSIRKAAEAAGASFDLEVVYLSDVEAIRRACGIDGTAAARAPIVERASLTLEEAQALRDFYRAAVPRITPSANDAEHAELRRVTRRAREVLQRLSDEFVANHPRRA